MRLEKPNNLPKKLLKSANNLRILKNFGPNSKLSICKVHTARGLAVRELWNQTETNFHVNGSIHLTRLEMFSVASY